MLQIEDHTFFQDGLSSRSVVLDLGANHGRFAHEIIRRFDCNVHAVEANPELLQSIAPHQRLTRLNSAVAAKSGTIPFHISGRSDEASTIITSGAADAVRTVEIQSVTLSELIERFADPMVDLLKLDIEGAEIEVFEATSDALLQRCVQVTVEFHDFCGLISPEAADRTAKRFQRLGFYVVKMWMRSHGDTLFINRSHASVTPMQLAWSRYAVKNWWWLQRKIATKLALRHP